MMPNPSAEEKRRAGKAAFQAEMVRQDILRHAVDLFSHYGFWKTNIGDIAERAGMSPGNIYRYFRNKQAIGLAVVQSYFEAEHTIMETELLLGGGSAEERIRRFILAGVGQLAQELEIHPKIVELADFICSDEEGMAALQAHIAWKRGKLAAELKRGMEAGEIAPFDPEQLAATVLNTIKIYFMPMTLTLWRDPATILPELEDSLDLIFRGLRAR